MNGNAYSQQQPAPGLPPQAGSLPSPASSFPPLEVWGATDRGREREGNEDAIYPHSGSVTGFVPSAERVAQRGRMLVVADGVGGGRAGPEASRWAVRVVVDRYYDLSGSDLGADLRTAIETANASLFQYLQATNTTNAGTTMVAAVIHGNTLHVANVGDSRAYLLRDGKPYRLTHDHTLTEQKLAQGLITPEQALTDPDRNVLTRSLGARQTVQVDLFPPQQLQPGDVVLVCSDGLVDMLSDEEIARLVGDRTPKRAAQRLIAEANRRGGFDNISVVIARIGGTPPPVSAPPRKGKAGGGFGRLQSDFRRMSARQKVILGVGAALVALTFCLLAVLAFVAADGTNRPTPTASPPLLTASPPAEESAPAISPVPTATVNPRATSTPVPTATSTPTATRRPPTPTPPPPTETPTAMPTTLPGSGGEGGGSEPPTTTTTPQRP